MGNSKWKKVADASLPRPSASRGVMEIILQTYQIHMVCRALVEGPSSITACNDSLQIRYSFSFVFYYITVKKL